ncbi:signal peptidase II [Candidatus Parcubacteria bacterium]|nr:MAG: signal peptidase II [Candidatus Parcubacteria bacterium]
MKTKTHIITSVISSGFFLLFDQLLKYIARTNPDHTYYLWQPWIGWEYFENTGIAFGLPLPQPIILLLTPVIIILIVGWWTQKKKPNALFYWGTILIITGALSNFIDRILFAITIDYVRIITSVFNIADILIVTGAFLLFLQELHKDKNIKRDIL